jgi:hypothetical protein
MVTEDELRELREEVLNATSGARTKDVKIVSDGRQYSVRIPKRFIEEGEVNVKNDIFRVKLEIPEYKSEEKPKLTAELIRQNEKETKI